MCRMIVIQTKMDKVLSVGEVIEMILKCSKVNNTKDGSVNFISNGKFKILLNSNEFVVIDKTNKNEIVLKGLTLEELKNFIVSSF